MIYWTYTDYIALQYLEQTEYLKKKQTNQNPTKQNPTKKIKTTGCHKKKIQIYNAVENWSSLVVWAFCGTGTHRSVRPHKSIESVQITDFSEVGVPFFLTLVKSYWKEA